MVLHRGLSDTICQPAFTITHQFVNSNQLGVQQDEISEFGRMVVKSFDHEPHETIRFFGSSMHVRDHIKYFENSSHENISYRVEPPPALFYTNDFWVQNFHNFSNVWVKYSITIPTRTCHFKPSPFRVYTKTFRVKNFESFDMVLNVGSQVNW